MRAGVTTGGCADDRRRAPEAEPKEGRKAKGPIGYTNAFQSNHAAQSLNKRIRGGRERSGLMVSKVFGVGRRNERNGGRVPWTLLHQQPSCTGRWRCAVLVLPVGGRPTTGNVGG